MDKVKFNNVFVNDIIKACRKGKFILIFTNIKIRKILEKELLNDKIALKRGIFTFKGIIVISTIKNKEFEKYFDLVVEVIDG